MLRGPRPDPGLAGICTAPRCAAIRTPQKSLTCAVVRALAEKLAPFARAMAANAHRACATLAQAHARCGSAGRNRRANDGATRLWRGEPAKRRPNSVLALARGGADFPPSNRGYMPRCSAHWRKSARSGPPMASHPRLAILGPLEARLQRFRCRRAGRIERRHMAASAAGRSMAVAPHAQDVRTWNRRSARIGLAAHDFATLAAGPARVSHALAQSPMARRPSPRAGCNVCNS